MKTRCPDCKTVFRATSDQLRARKGKVRCGHCGKVFNALAHTVERSSAGVPAPALTPIPAPQISAVAEEVRAESTNARNLERHGGASAPEGIRARAADARNTPDTQAAPDVPETRQEGRPAPSSDEPGDSKTRTAEKKRRSQKRPRAAPPDEKREANPDTKPDFPRKITKIPGDGKRLEDKWAEDVMAPPIEIPAEAPPHWPFTLAAAGLSLVFAIQVLFHFRSELAISLPSLRPAFDVFSRVLDGPLPLPANVDLVSIEASDLQTDTSRNRLLVLNATLRNKAAYEQAYPSLELSLTDIQDTVIARRVFAPQDYLPAKTGSPQTFASNSDLAVRLWIEAVDLNAAGYRLFVFYP